MSAEELRVGLAQIVIEAHERNTARGLLTAREERAVAVSAIVTTFAECREASGSIPVALKAAAEQHGVEPRTVGLLVGLTSQYLALIGFTK